MKVVGISQKVGEGVAFKDKDSEAQVGAVARSQWQSRGWKAFWAACKGDSVDSTLRVVREGFLEEASPV